MNIEEFVQLDNFEELCKEKNIDVLRDGDYMLLKYGVGADFTDPIVKQSRGIIFKNNKVVCKPFDKFCNYGEAGADEIDWDSARVQQKIDGSLIKCFYDKYWHFATSGTICASNAMAAENKSFLMLIHEADNFCAIPFDKMNIENTYMFELVGPSNRVVINYPKTHLYHIGTRNKNGIETDEDIGIERPKEFDIHNINDCIKAAEALNPNDELTDEGFVVVDKYFRRIKVKSPKYILMHRAINNGVVTYKRIIEAIRGGNEEVYYKTEQTRVKYLETKYLLAKLEYLIEKDIQSAKSIYEEFDFDKKRTAEEIEKLKYKAFCFRALDNDITANELMWRLPNKKLKIYMEDIK